MKRQQLARYELFYSHDLDDVREQMGRVFVPHRLTFAGRSRRLNARFRVRPLRDVTFTYVTYGGDMDVVPGPLDTFTVVMMPLSGRARIRCGEQEIVAKPGLAAVISPTEDLEMRWSPDCAMWVCRIERHALEALVAGMLGRRLREPLRFQLGMDQRSGMGRLWRTTHDTLLTEADADVSIINRIELGLQLERDLALALLMAQPHNYRAELEAEAAPAPPREVALVLAFMEAHSERDHSPASLARWAGSSGRTLQRGLREHRGLTVHEYLTDARVRRVHDRLLAYDPDLITVHAAIADQGTAPSEHFYDAYRARYDETPTDTLHRSLRP